MENCIEVSQKVETTLPYDPAILFCIYIQSKWKWDIEEISAPHVYCNIIHNSKDVGTTSASVNGWKAKEDVMERRCDGEKMWCRREMEEDGGRESHCDNLFPQTHTFLPRKQVYRK